MFKLFSKIFFFLNHYRIRKCLYCGRIKFCEYIDYKMEDKGIKGSFCKVCQKIPLEDIFFILEDKQYYIFKAVYK